MPPPPRTSPLVISIRMMSRALSALEREPGEDHGRVLVPSVFFQGLCRWRHSHAYAGRVSCRQGLRKGPVASGF